MKFIDQDILKLTSGTICHQINSVGAVGGLNKAICNQWPEVKLAITPPDDPLELGTIVIVKYDNLWIANIVAQNYPGRSFMGDSYEVRRKLLTDALVQVSILSPYDDIYIPYNIGCGLGGDRWKFMLPELERAESEFMFNRKLTVCKPSWLN